MDIQLLLTIAAKAFIVYAFLFGVVRLLGKRKLGIHSAFDLVVAIVMADLASQAIFGNVTLFHGLFAVAILGVTHFAGYYASTRNARMQRLLMGEPTVLVRDGEIVPHVLKSERIGEGELWSQLRQQGVENIGDVKLAIIEPSGRISVVRQEWAREVQKGDLRTLSGRGDA